MIRTVENLIEAYVRGNVVAPLLLDNDNVSVDGRDGRLAFEMHPEVLLRALLDEAGIPWEEV